MRDLLGDSFLLSKLASESDAKFVIFCGVHFMAESADILTGDHQSVILPNLRAGCSMADMAVLEDVQSAWDSILQLTDLRDHWTGKMRIKSLMMTSRFWFQLPT